MPMKLRMLAEKVYGTDVHGRKVGDGEGEVQEEAKMRGGERRRKGKELRRRGVRRRRGRWRMSGRTWIVKRRSRCCKR